VYGFVRVQLYCHMTKTTFTRNCRICLQIKFKATNTYPMYHVNKNVSHNYQQQHTGRLHRY